MLFNFNIFSALASRAYNTIENPFYSLEDVLSVFKYYFQTYEDTFHKAHPNIRLTQIEKIIKIMPFIDSNSCGGHVSDIEVDVDSYESLIDKHFQTQYQNCDYNINHFFAGDIRLMRFYEELY